MYEDIRLLINNNNSNSLDVNYYRSNYGADKKWVSNNKDDDFKYPVVYSINKVNKISLKYSNINNKGHFTKSKFIFSNGSGFYCDKLGEYGLTQWAYCIYDIPENLSNIETAFRTDKFNNIKQAIKLDSSNYNIKVMKKFRHDFYKDMNDNNKEQTNSINKLKEQTNSINKLKEQTNSINKLKRTN